jgi:hypothetical protein
LLTALTFSAHATAALTADYRFQGNLNDSLPGGSALISNGGTVGATTYDFSYGQGLFGSGILANGGDWSLVIRFLFTENSGFNKFVDFKNRGSDCGEYVSPTIGFFCMTGSVGPVFATDIFHDVVLTRDGGTSAYNAYLDGSLVFSAVDTTNAIFDVNNGTMYFMGDDLVAGNTENSPGSVDRIRIYDGALTGAEVSQLDLSEPNGAGVPEPQTGALFGSAIAGLLMLGRRRPR